MKKFITERKWNKLYEQATDGFYEKKYADGSKEYTKEGFEKYKNAVMNFPEYRIIGIRHQLGMLKDRWKNYKLRHLCIGKVKMMDKNNNDNFKIEKISWDIHWQTYLYLTVIIRDYLRFFINNTPAIGNCVIKKEDRENILYRATEDDWNKWKALVNSVADEFDEIIRLTEEVDTSRDISERKALDEARKALIKRAFSDLAYIYDDLWW